MTMPIQPVYGLPGDKQSNQIGAFVKRSGVIKSDTLSIDNLGMDIGQYFKWLYVGVGGDIFWLTPELQVAGMTAVGDNTWIPAVGSMVLETGTYEGVSVSTTCDEITWFGGE